MRFCWFCHEAAQHTNFRSSVFKILSKVILSDTVHSVNDKTICESLHNNFFEAYIAGNMLFSFSVTEVVSEVI